MDFLYAISCKYTTIFDDIHVIRILTHAMVCLSEGEIQQLTEIKNLKITKKRYLQIISNKTAKLFEASCEMTLALATKDQKLIQAASCYGQYIGVAFQLIDDLLDYTGDTNDIGKHIGDDLIEGKVTLPVIHALKYSNTKDQKIIRHALLNGDISKVEQIYDILIKTNAISYTKTYALDTINQANKALQPFPETPYKQALSSIGYHTLHRSN